MEFDWSGEDARFRAALAAFLDEQLPADWEELAKDCFSCGSCNIVCCTCYCFDVQDEWTVDGKGGKR